MAETYEKDVQKVISLADGSKAMVVLKRVPTEMEINVFSKTKIYFSHALQLVAYKDGKEAQMDSPGWNLSPIYESTLRTNTWYIDGGYDPDDEQHADLPIYFRKESGTGIPKSVSPPSSTKLGKFYGLPHEVRFTNAFEDGPGPRSGDLQEFGADYKDIDYLVMMFRTYLVEKVGDRLAPVGKVYWYGLTAYGRKGGQAFNSVFNLPPASHQDYPRCLYLLTPTFDPANPKAGIDPVNPTISNTVDTKEKQMFSDLQTHWIQKVKTLGKALYHVA